MRLLIRNLNLETVVRPAVVEELITLMDADHDDEISFAEFARVVTSEDIFEMKEMAVRMA